TTGLRFRGGGPIARRKVVTPVNSFCELDAEEVRRKVVPRFHKSNYVPINCHENACLNADPAHDRLPHMFSVLSFGYLFNVPLGDSEAAEDKGKAERKRYDKPNIVSGANVQVCREKFARYFDVELKEVKLREGYYVMDPVKAVELVDENNICMAAIRGPTLNGEFEDVKLLNDLWLEKNKETGRDTPIHVDAASGRFIPTFLYPELEWDFRLPPVKSINVSGLNYGPVYAGVGWVIWRSKENLPEELIFHINYLGDDQPTFTLNVSNGYQIFLL
ncbi:hypothetical protein CRG98_046030, partial [Punica granatum]